MSILQWLPLIFVFVLLALRIPVCAAFISGAVLYFGFIAPEMPLNIILSKMVTGGMNMNLMAIPFFITAGLLMNHTGITSRMMKFADLCVGHMWGGMAQVNVLLSTLMGGLCGSSNADAAMQCKMLVPEMEKRGFNRAFSAAVTAASSLISPIIPPGVMLILYATITENSVLDMFMAGYIPGILMCITMMIAVKYVSHRDGYKPTCEKRASFKEIVKGFIDCRWAILMIVALIVGLRSGIVTATEGGAVLCVLCVFVGMVIYKELKLADFKGILKEAFSSVAFKSCESASTWVSHCSVLPFCRTEGRITLSSAVRFCNNVWLCVMKPMVRLRTIDICLSFSRVTSLPSKSMDPYVGLSRPVIRFSNVLLPLPERPTIATNSP